MSSKVPAVGELFKCAGQRKKHRKPVEHMVRGNEAVEQISKTHANVDKVEATAVNDEFVISSPVRSRQSQFRPGYDLPRVSSKLYANGIEMHPPVDPQNPLRRATQLRPLTLLTLKQNVIAEAEEEDESPERTTESAPGERKRATMSFIVSSILGIDFQQSTANKKGQTATTIVRPKTSYMPYNDSTPPSENQYPRRPVSAVRHVAVSSSNRNIDRQIRSSHLAPTEAWKRRHSEVPSGPRANMPYASKEPSQTAMEGHAKFVHLENLRSASSEDVPITVQAQQKITSPPRAMVAGTDISEERQRRVKQALKEKVDAEVRMVQVERSVKVKNEGAEASSNSEISRSTSNGSRSSGLPSNPRPDRPKSSAASLSTSPTSQSSDIKQEVNTIRQPDIINPAATDEAHKAASDEHFNISESASMVVTKGHRVKDWLAKQSDNYRLRMKSISLDPSSSHTKLPTPPLSPDFEPLPTNTVFEPSPLSSPSIVDASHPFDASEFQFVFPTTRKSVILPSASNRHSRLLTPVIRPYTLAPNYMHLEGGMESARSSIATTNFFSEATWEPFLNAKDLDTAMNYLRTRAEMGNRVAMAI